jgi:ADP-ribose pyrophosphatase
MEETGYRAARFKFVGAIYPVPGYSTEKIFIYKAEGLKRVKHIPEDDEVIKVRTFSQMEVKKLFKSGKIVDAKTIAALAYCDWL